MDSDIISMVKYSMSWCQLETAQIVLTILDQSPEYKKIAL